MSELDEQHKAAEKYCEGRDDVNGCEFDAFRAGWKARAEYLKTQQESWGPDLSDDDMIWRDE